MSSQYDSIKTPKELIDHVMCHGFSTIQEDLCRAQDIFGRAPIEDLVFLANDIGRDNENGEPDPKGTFSSGRRGTQSTFYMILSSIWNWEDVTRFWNQRTNPEHEELEQLRVKRKEILLRDSRLSREIDTERNLRLKESAAKLEAEQKAARLETELHDRDMEIMALKAKLYDMMMKEVN